MLFSEEIVQLIVAVCAALPSESRLPCLILALKWNKVHPFIHVTLNRISLILIKYLCVALRCDLNPQAVLSSSAAHPALHLAVAQTLEQNRQFISSFAHYARSGEVEGASLIAAPARFRHLFFEAFFFLISF
jgi:hypothetical protein